LDTRTTTSILELKDLSLAYSQGERDIHVLREASASVSPGEAVGLLGPSGAGKSSLLHLIGLLDQPGSGQILLNGVDCATLSDDARTAIRRTMLGFIYQFHHLLPEFSATENVVLPQLIAGKSRKDATERADALLKMLGLGERGVHRPGQLSGGEQQRVAIARAVANRPRILLADEPTGNLDPETAELVFEQLRLLVETEQLAAIIATHNMDIARRMDRVWRLTDGKIVEVSPSKV
jgi:lipoprotein-releasing system ATP-binding protein